MDDYRNSPTIKFYADVLFPVHRCPAGDKVLREGTFFIGGGGGGGGGGWAGTLEERVLSNFFTNWGGSNLFYS